MIEQIQNLPTNIVGFKASGEVTAEDFTNDVLPIVEMLVAKTGKLNYLFVLHTSLKNFTFGAWVKDTMIGMKNITKWNRAAIVSDVDAIRSFTNIFSVIMPGDFKGFKHEEMQDAIDWVSEKT